MSRVRLLAPAAVTALIMSAGCTPLQAGLAHASAAKAPGAGVSAPKTVKKWNALSPSLRVAPRVLTDAVAPKETVRVVRLASSAGRPVLSVTTAVGPAAADAAVRDVQQAPGSLAVTVDRRRTTLGEPLSNDSYRTQQWALTTLAAEDTWDYSRGSGVTVAVIDTGVSKQPDLAGQVLTGIDYVTGSGDGSADGYGHGTHVAGIIAAIANNHLGVAGIAPGVKILPIRALDANGSGWDSDIAAGIVYAADHGAGVINMSLGGPDDDPILASAVSYAQSKNVLVVAAGGNERETGNLPSYPAAYPNVLAVAASDSTNQTGYFSNTGSYVRIAAPGVDIMSTVPGGYASESGTSMASPYAAGVAALVRSAAPGLSANAVAADLTATATDLAPLGRDDASGAGLVNPKAAVCAVIVCGSVVPIINTRIDVQRPPAGINYGQAATLRAHLRDTLTGRGLAGKHIVWCYGLPGKPARCGSSTTDASGWSSYRIAPLIGGQVSATYTGESRVRASSSTRYSIVVPPAITQRAGHATLAVTLRPAVAQHYTLQRWTGKVWVTLASGSTDAAGRVTFRRLASRAIVRIVIAATAGRASAASAPIRIR